MNKLEKGRSRDTSGGTMKISFSAGLSTGIVFTNICKIWSSCMGGLFASLRPGGFRRGSLDILSKRIVAKPIVFIVFLETTITKLEKGRSRDHSGGAMRTSFSAGLSDIEFVHGGIVRKPLSRRVMAG